MLKKRGISPIIASVLLVLIVVVLAAIFAVYGLPFVQNLFGSEDCFEVLGDINFDKSSNYNCYYDDESGQKRTGFSVKIDNEGVKGFRVGLLHEGSSDVIDITQDSTFPIIRMIDGVFGGALNINNKGGVRIYVANGIFERIDMFPILSNGKVCTDSSKALEPVECLDIDVRNSLHDDEGDSGNGECTLNSAYWSNSNGGALSILTVDEGTRVYLTTTGSEECNDKDVNLEIWEDDSSDPDKLNYSPTATFVNGKAIVSWDAEWQCDGFNLFGYCFSDPPEYYFESSLVEDNSKSISSSKIEEDELKVLRTEPVCGNQRIESGETCDPPSDDEVSCQTSEGYDGTRTCLNSCQYDECNTDQFCGDGEVNGGENCITCPEDAGQCPQCTLDSDCDDNNICNGQETCDVDGQCVSGTQLQCGVYQCYPDTGCGFCGDGEVNGDEQCEIGDSRLCLSDGTSGDAGGLGGFSGMAPGSGNDGTQTCTAQCTWDECVADP
ncbi:hypothetical protein COU60_03110 [Candidatus Pacearchaeota archaeon CG10_big_fil_rev_8_21_14_0_10_34_76]|nr:MAG: hypothetical protein COU60_03110 [Candidatus Pacearchaeota archaeon CG10_big_fil_rev_8_21_14_0_10_34_76]